MRFSEGGGRNPHCSNLCPLANHYSYYSNQGFNSNFSVNQQMIKEYHAVPYFGQSKDETEQGHLWNRAALNEQGIKYIK